MAHNQEKYLFKIKKEIQCVVRHTVFAVYDILLSIQSLVLIKYDFHFIHSFIPPVTRERECRLFGPGHACRGEVDPQESRAIVWAQVLELRSSGWGARAFTH